MSVRIQLYGNPHGFYTNLDYISGKVILSLPRDESISAIVVKLEGESKTFLMAVPNPAEYGRRNNDRPRPAIEHHKILYKVEQLFPSNNPASGPASGLVYTLKAGQHEYPFRMKIPVNNACAKQNTQIGFGGFRIDMPQQMNVTHVSKTLPPSMSGFPGEAEIRYYVKVTVQRPSMFKENRRALIGFKFLPIEPPRPTPTAQERFAKRQHVFEAGLAPYAKKKGMFSKAPAVLSSTPPSVEVSARLPSPPILTCNKPVPLKVIVKKRRQSPEYVFLVSLQVELIGFTEVRAENVCRTEPTSHIVMTLAGLSKQINGPSDEVGFEAVLDANMWNGVPLPRTVTPTFHTCNLLRHYDLEVKVGLAYGLPGDIQPQIIILPLRFPVEVYSGIAPPPGLLNAMASRPPAATQPAQSTAPTYDPEFPPQLGTPGAPAATDAPPSYEDALAANFTHDDGPRAEYSGFTNENAPSEVGSAPAYSSGDKKRGNRLFPDSGPGPAPGSGGG